MRRRHQELLKQTGALVAFMILIVGASKLGKLERPAVPVTGQDLLTQRYENAVLTVVLEGFKRQASGLVLATRSLDGHALTVFVTKDVGHAPLRVGDRYEVIGTSMGQAAISLSRPNALKHLPTPKTVSLQKAYVEDGWAYVTTALGTSRFPASQLSDGHQDVAVVVDLAQRLHAQEAR